MRALRVIEGPAKGKCFELKDDVVFLGRGARNDIHINDHTLSRIHLKIFKIGPAVFAEDLKSSKGTLINGMRIEPGEGRQVDEQDRITLGDTVIRLEVVTKSNNLESKEPMEPASKKSEEASQSLEVTERRLRPFKETEFLSRLSERLRDPITLGEALKNMSEQILGILPRTDRLAVFIRENETGDFKKAAVMMSKTDRKDDPVRTKVVEEVFAKGQAVIVEDADRQRPCDPRHEEETVQIRSLLSIPMTAHGTVFGALYMDAVRASSLSRKEDMLWLWTACTIIAYAIENAELSYKMSRIAHLCRPRQSGINNS
ncbi:MAG: FHA domain-containing protein [Deltaproteobacteria bacterium]|nr:FHA domain-containing protein [Deltaproteobacteria bacterium]